MSIMRSIRPLALYVGSLLLLAATSVQAETPLIIHLATGINSDPPYVYGDRSLRTQDPGITIELLRRIEERLGVRFVIDKRPWARVVYEVQNNRLDGGFHFSYRPERAAFVQYPMMNWAKQPDVRYSLPSRAYYLYRLEGRALYWGGLGIQGSEGGLPVIAVIRGSSVIGTLKAQGYPLREVNTDAQLIQLLQARQVDAFAAIDNMLDPKLTELDTWHSLKIEKDRLPIRQKPYYLGFSKGFYFRHPYIAWAIWGEIERLKSSGELERLHAYYAQLPESVGAE